MKVYSAIFGLAALVAAHGGHDQHQEPMEGPHEGLWYNTLPGDGGTQVRPADIPSVLNHSIDSLTG